MWLCLIVAFGVLVASGCGGEDGEEAEQAPTTSADRAAETDPLGADPCALLPEERIAELFGASVQGRFERGEDANVCGYRSDRPADPKVSPPVPSGIDVFLGVPYFVELSEQLDRQAARPVTELPGIGDAAYLSGTSAAAVEGDAGIMVATLGLSPSDRALEELLAELLSEAVAAYP